MWLGIGCVCWNDVTVHVCAFNSVTYFYVYNAYHHLVFSIIIMLYTASHL
jgi:hypothetical protein